LIESDIDTAKEDTTENKDNDPRSEGFTYWKDQSSSGRESNAKGMGPRNVNRSLLFNSVFVVLLSRLRRRLFVDFVDLVG